LELWYKISIFAQENSFDALTATLDAKD
jgi:hypothetical protein